MEEQNIQNEQTEHKLNPILNLTGRGHFFVYNFARLRDWRVVQMADAQGVIREGIFLPFLQNGNTASKLGVKTYSPCISRVAHEKLVEQGLLLPGYTPWSEPCMGFRVRDFGFCGKKK